MRCSYLLIELITRYFPFVFHLVLNFLQLLCISLVQLTFSYSAQILLENALICPSLRLVCAVCPSNPKGSPGRRLETINTEPS